MKQEQNSRTNQSSYTIEPANQLKKEQNSRTYQSSYTIEPANRPQFQPSKKNKSDNTTPRNKNPLDPLSCLGKFKINT